MRDLSKRKTLVDVSTPGIDGPIPGPVPGIDSRRKGSQALPAGLLIINADDWGRDRETTDRIFECIERGTVSSTSAMVFMEDSERAAGMAREFGIDAGLHLNFTTPFLTPGCPTRVLERQHNLAAYLRRYPLARVIFQPWFVRSFEYVVAAQIEEYQRLYQKEPHRLDGHHHMHLCTNVLLQRLLPPGTLVRRSFSFGTAEKSYVNRLYRRLVDRTLARRHRIGDFFFSLPPLDPRDRLQRIFSLARQWVVEVETHPVNPEEYRFLTGDEIYRWTGDIAIAPGFAVPREGFVGKSA